MARELARLVGALVLLSVAALTQTSPTSTTPGADLKQPSTQREKPPREFFAGVITGINDRQITVSRTGRSRVTVRRTFVVNPDTKMNRSAVKLRSKVTVRYRHSTDGDIALEILLQPLTRRPKTL